MKIKHKYIGAIIYGSILTLFTLYVVLDIFVIQHKYQENATGVNESLFAPTPTAPLPTPTVTVSVAPTAEITPTPGPTNTPTPTPTPSIFSTEEVITDDFYSNDHLAVKVTNYYEYKTNVHVAEVWVSSPRYLMSAFARDTYGMHVNEKTTVMAKNNDAVLAINGDNYGQRQGGYVVRNGVSYRAKGDSAKDVLCILANGDFRFCSGSNPVPLEEYVNMGAWQVFSFGPVLLDNNEIQVAENYEIKDNYGSNPRTAIGMIEPNHYILLCSDGRTKTDKGLSCYELAEFMQSLGCTKAFNLDGGGSSTMVFMNKVVNFPTTYGSYSERAVADIIYVR